MSFKPKRLNSVVDEMNTCTACATCLVTCDVFQVLQWDSSSPRGRVQLAYGLYTGEIEPDNSVLTRIYQCTKCGRCEQECPSSVKLLDIFDAARHDLFEAGYRLENYEKFGNKILSEGNPYNGEEPRWKVFGKEPKERAEVAYFMGCKVAFQEQEMGRATIGLLEHLGVDYTLLDETCCGAPLVNAGVPDEEIEKIARRNVGEIAKRGVKTVIFSCPSCMISFKDIYSGFMELPFEVKHEVEFFREYGMELKHTDEKVTYHDPCHLGRHYGIYDEPRELITRVPDIDFVEMENSREKALCCGAGGSMKLADKGLGVKIGRIRMEEAGERTVITACPNCKNNLAISGRVKSVSELLYENLK
jgi:Fe-S oxidoreductase